MTMLSTNRLWKRHCTLTRYLEETSSRTSDTQAVMAAVMLADMGYFEKNPQYHEVADLTLSLDSQIKEGYADTLTETVSLCKACTVSLGCQVGMYIVRRG